MVRISQLKLPIDAPVRQLQGQICQKLHVAEADIAHWEILRRSLDARQGRAICFSYTVDVTLKSQSAMQKRLRSQKDLQWLDGADFHASLQKLYKKVSVSDAERPVVIGFGPAGMFCALLLARAGLKPVILERGRSVEERTADVRRFWQTGQLDTQSNVQFGEGGAGTFSDGKLNTLIKDKEGIGRFVLKEFTLAGAPEEILYDQKPHVGTDRLRLVVRHIREEIISLGGTIHFGAQVTDLESLPDGQVCVTYAENGDAASVQTLLTGTAFLGIGHSARDTFRMLQSRGMIMEPKPFAVGFRIEHPQSFIDQRQYREYAGHPALSHAAYKVAWQDSRSQTQRGVYSFCMCPGGLVVAAASETGQVVTNGMSNYARDEVNANSALLVTVTPDDFRSYAKNEDTANDPLCGVAFQRELERSAYRLGGGEYAAPAQYVGDYLRSCDLEAPRTGTFSTVQPSYTRGVKEAPLKDLLGTELSGTLARGLIGIDHEMPGFADGGAMMTGIESRSSSPVRLVRGEDMQSSMPGIYPIGEGAGYAGGIMSAAIDGIKAAVTYLKRFA